MSELTRPADKQTNISLQDVESYSGFLTVDKPNSGNMFFWFFPAEESPETAPVVIWLQVRLSCFCPCP